MKSLNWKKNLFSYAAWLACLLLTVFGGSAVVRLWLPELGLSGDAAAYGILGGVLLLAGLLNVIVWFFFKKRREGRKSGRGGWVPGLVEKTLCLILLALGLFLRWEKLPLADGGEYFEMASMKAGQGVPFLLHGAEYLYVLALHGICFVLGNHPVFCAWFHLILQGLAGFLCLLGIRRLTGGFSAVVFSAYYFLSPGMIGQGMTLSPEPLVLLGFGTGLLAAGGFLKKSSGLPTGYFLTGMVIALAAYLDISGLALLCILFTVLFVEREEPERLWNRPPFSLLTALAGFGMTLAGIFALDASVSGSSLKKVAAAWGGLYLPAGTSVVDPLRPLLEMKWGRELISLLFVLLALGVFSFFFWRRQERISVWILAGGVLYALETFGMTAPAMSVGEPFLLCLCALAGTALSNYGREIVLEKAGMRKWDPSLYGIVEEDGESSGTRYSEGEYKEGGSAGGRFTELGNAEREYSRDGKDAYFVKETVTAGDWNSVESEAAGIVEKRAMDEMTGRENERIEEPAGEQLTAGAPEEEEASARETQTSGREGGNFFTRMLEEKKRKKEEQRQEMERVLSALSAISDDAEVLISPDHKPGEDLVKGPVREGAERPPESSRTDEGKRKGFGRRKTGISARESAGAVGEKAEDQSGEENAGSAAGRENEALEDGRKPLHNPLPVPKKKEATMLDYDYEVSDEDDYDYD